MNTENLRSDLTIVAVEILLAVLVLAVLYWLSSRCLAIVFSMPVLDSFERGAAAVRASLRRVFVLGGLLLCLGMISANAFIRASGEELVPYTLGLLRGIPVDFWTGLAVAAAKILGLAMVIVLVLRILRRLLDHLGARAKAFEGIQANDESIDQLFRVLKQVFGRAAWLLVLVVSVRWLRVPEPAAAALIIALRVYLILAISRLVWRALDVIVATLEALAEKYADSKGLLRYYDRLRRLVPLLRRTIEYGIYLFAGTLVVSQLEATAPLADWGHRLIKILGLFFLSRMVIEIAHLVVKEVLLTRPELSASEQQQRLTFVPILRSGLKWGIFFVFGIFALRLLGINPTPVLAGAGIVGLAVGFGAQNLITDLVAGFFILFEEYYLVGDFIETGEASGTVEAIDLRTTRIRDTVGRYHIIRNGQIKKLINYSKEYTCAKVEVGVAYDSDLDEVFAALAAVGEKIHRDDDVLEPSAVLGVEDLGESEIVVRILTKVKPGCHKPVERAVRKLIKEEFDARGIEIPFARRVILFDRNKDGEDLAERLKPAGSRAL